MASSEKNRRAAKGTTRGQGLMANSRTGPYQAWEGKGLEQELASDVCM